MVTGGLVTTIAGVRLSARSPLTAFTLSVLTFGVWLVAARRGGGISDALASLQSTLQRRWRGITAFVALIAMAVASAFHTFSATGADASGYLSYAQHLVRGELTHEEPLAPVADWQGGPATLAPLGWSAMSEEGRQAPTYAIGLPLLMAPPMMTGGDRAASMLGPLSLGIAVVVIAAIASRFGGAFAALLAAVWLATSPVALGQAMQVMSDVPVMAAWLLCWLGVFHRRARLAGLAAAVAVLIRPNLAPLSLVPAAYILWTERPRASAAIEFVTPVSIAGLVVGYLQWRYFGSPFRSGYGTAEEIYALANIVPNARLYASWLIDTHGPWLFAAPLALFLIRRRELVWLFAFAALGVFSYLVYAQFETWTYLRFMLPALAIAMVAVSSTIVRLGHRAPLAIRICGGAALLLAVMSVNISAGRELEIFRTADRQARGRYVGEQLAGTLPPNAVIISSEHSGTMRYYTGRTVLRWDLLEPQTMPEAIDRLRRDGYQLWLVLDDWEEELFRKKFPALAAESLDYAPNVESAPGVGIRTRAWILRCPGCPVAP